MTQNPRLSHENIRNHIRKQINFRFYRRKNDKTESTRRANFSIFRSSSYQDDSIELLWTSVLWESRKLQLYLTIEKKITSLIFKKILTKVKMIRSLFQILPWINFVFRWTVCETYRHSGTCCKKESISRAFSGALGVTSSAGCSVYLNVSNEFFLEKSSINHD